MNKFIDTIERLRELEKKATPGPWSTLDEEGEVHAETLQDAGGDPFHVIEATKPDDAEFICASRNLLPGLLAMLDEAVEIKDQVLRTEVKEVVLVMEQVKGKPDKAEVRKALAELAEYRKKLRSMAHEFNKKYGVKSDE